MRAILGEIKFGDFKKLSITSVTNSRKRFQKKEIVHICMYIFKYAHFLSL